MRLLPLSAIYKLPLESLAIPVGKLSKAAVPTPFVFPLVVVPMIVVTTPADDIFLIIWLYLSTTYILSFESITIPSGVRKVAAVPVPSALPLVVEPALQVKLKK